MPARRRFIDQPPSLDDQVDEPESPTSEFTAVAVHPDLYLRLVEGEQVQLDDAVFATTGVPVIDERIEVSSSEDPDALAVPVTVVDLDADTVIVAPA